MATNLYYEIKELIEIGTFEVRKYVLSAGGAVTFRVNQKIVRLVSIYEE